MITSGTARMMAKTTRSGRRTQEGPTLPAASIPRGIETITHRIAPIHAMEMERHISNRARGRRSQFGSANMSVL